MPTDMITARDEISSAAIKAVLIDFWEYAHKNIESVNFDLRLVKAKDRFIDVAQKEATNRGYTVMDAYLHAFSEWDRYKVELSEELRKELSAVQKEHAVNQIRAVQVGCTIEPKIREASLPYCIVYQKYRLKICIRIDYKSHLEFYIRYRDLGDEQIIDGIPEMISNSVRYIQNYGPQMSLREDHYDYAWTYPENYTE